MNDFTKDELQNILTCVNGEIRSNINADKLASKIQSMIDDYCEHDGVIGIDYPAEKCMKCGAYWE